MRLVDRWFLKKKKKNSGVIRNPLNPLVSKATTNKNLIAQIYYLFVLDTQANDLLQCPPLKVTPLLNMTKERWLVLILLTFC